MRKKTDELIDMLRARNPLIYVNTYEENAFISELCTAVSRIATSDKTKCSAPPQIFVYTRPSGLYSIDLNNPNEYDESKVVKNINTISEALNYVRHVQSNMKAKIDKSIFSAIGKDNTEQKTENNFNRQAIFVFKDLYMYFSDKDIVRLIRDCKENYLSNSYCPIIVTGCTTDIPPELEKVFTVWDFPLMDKEEIIEYFDTFLNTWDYTEKEFNSLASAASGLTDREIMKIFMQTLAEKKRIGCNKVTPSDISKEKIQIVKKSGCIDYIEPKYNIDDLGGCDNFKEWMHKVKEATSDEARQFGIPFPKGAMLVGVPGTSKTASAEILASYLNVPLLSLQMSKIMGSFVGQSERAIANALRIAKAVSPCVLLLDEAEKSIGGVQSSNSSDSGTLSRVMASFLNFLQDDSNVIVMMTSNDVSQLPPELTRSGRIDAQWIFDLPNKAERHEIIDIYLKKNNLFVDKELHDYIDETTKNFTGAEIKSAVKDMLINLYYRLKKTNQSLDNRKLDKSDIDDAIKNTVTVWKSSKEKIQAFRAYSKDRYLNASKSEEEISKIRKNLNPFNDYVPPVNSNESSNVITFK